MMNVTFRPVKMTAWQLQKEFLRAVKKFYNLPSAFTIMRIFGISSGFRRLGLWLVSRSGILFLRIYLFINKLSRYRLNHHSLYHFPPDRLCQKEEYGGKINRDLSSPH